MLTINLYKLNANNADNSIFKDKFSDITVNFNHQYINLASYNKSMHGYFFFLLFLLLFSSSSLIKKLLNNPH